jgi:hypothetical protein
MSSNFTQGKKKVRGGEFMNGVQERTCLINIFTVSLVSRKVGGLRGSYR